MLRSRLLRFTALLAAINAVAAEDARACDDLIVTINNQTDIDFYETCPVIDGTLFFINHTFQGPFELPGVESMPELSSGYLGPKLKGSDWVDDGVTSASMPDLTNVTSGGILFGYIQNLTSISFPKLEAITGGLAIMGCDKLLNVSLPALSTVDESIYLDGDFEEVNLPLLSTVNGGVYIDGDFDELNLPSLKSVSYLRVLSLGNISCPALGAAFSSLTFNATETDLYEGFTCWTPDENNTWDSSDNGSTSTTGGSSSTPTGSGSPTSTGAGSSSTSTGNSNTANAPRVGSTAIYFSLAMTTLLISFMM